MEITLDITPRYIKSEFNLLNILLEDTLKSKKLYYNINQLDIPEYKGSKFLFLERFCKKSLTYSIDKTQGILFPVSHFSISDNNILFNLTLNFKQAIFEESFLKNLDLKYVLKFEENFTKLFYYNFVKGVEREKNIIVSLEEIREILNLNEYNRFYDFEMNILKKLKSDIDEKTNFILEYSKIKNGEFKNNKVVAIEFSIKNKISNLKNIQTNELMGIISNRITNFKTTYELIYNALDSISVDEIKKILKYIAKNPKDFPHFEEGLENLLNKNIELKDHILIKELSYPYSNPLKLQNFIYQELPDDKKISNSIKNDIVASTAFLKKIYLAKEGEQIFLEGDSIVVSIVFSKTAETVIKFYKKIQGKGATYF